MQDLEKKAEAIIKELTLEEKIGMIHGAQLFQTKGVERLGIPSLIMSDGPMGVRQDFESDSWKSINNSDDYVTYIPCNSAIAATWNRKMAYQAGNVLGEETRGRGKDVILAPGVNIKRSPLCGRNFEYYSEDPYLTKELAVSCIQGIQRWDVAACVKHFALNNQETERLWVDVEISEEALRKIYLPAFYDAVKRGKAYCLMGAYNQYKGEHCCQSKELLNQILRTEWEYDGTVISDWGAVHDTRKAAEAGIDIEMSVTSNFEDYFMAAPLQELVEKGEISEKLLNEKVKHIVVLLMRLHKLDGKRKFGKYNSRKHQKKMLKIARESYILLKNSSSKLPLKEGSQKILVVGENADCAHAIGGGSAEIKALYEITPLMGMKMLLGGHNNISYVTGYTGKKQQVKKETNWQETSLEKKNDSDIQHDTEVIQEIERKKMREIAVDQAKKADCVIYVGGFDHTLDCEGIDKADMKLPYEQDQLIQELLEVQPETVIVLLGGSAAEMETWIQKAKTIVWGYYAGMEGGRALAEILFGKINPSGKLPETFYKTHKDCSAHILGEFPGGKKVKYSEGVLVGYRYNETMQIEPQFCFGHGLSYTTFEYMDLCVEKKEKKYNALLLKEEQIYQVSFYIKNVGNRKGKETAQVYFEREEGSPVMELVGFQKAEIEPKQKIYLVIQVNVPIEEKIHLCVGASIQDIRLWN